MIRVGTVNIDTSHPIAFAELFLKDGRAKYTAVYNDGFRTDDEVKNFIKLVVLVLCTEDKFFSIINPPKIN
jgi:hypothetical protein